MLQSAVDGAAKAGAAAAGTGAVGATAEAAAAPLSLALLALYGFSRVSTVVFNELKTVTFARVGDRHAPPSSQREGLV